VPLTGPQLDGSEAMAALVVPLGLLDRIPRPVLMSGVVPFLTCADMFALGASAKGLHSVALWACKAEALGFSGFEAAKGAIGPSPPSAVNTVIGAMRAEWEGTLVPSRKFDVTWGQERLYWRRQASVPLDSSPFSEHWRLASVCWLDVRGTHSVGPGDFSLFVRARRGDGLHCSLTRGLSISPGAPPGSNTDALEPLASSALPRGVWCLIHVGDVAVLSRAAAGAGSATASVADTGSRWSPPELTQVRWFLTNHSGNWKSDLALDYSVALPTAMLGALELDHGAALEQGWLPETPASLRAFTDRAVLWRREWSGVNCPTAARADAGGSIGDGVRAALAGVGTRLMGGLSSIFGGIADTS
jgi:hypothetical protein